MGDNQLPGTYESLNVYIRKKDIQTLRSHKQPAHVHFETPPVQQIQVAWIEGLKLKLKSGDTISFNIYSATLAGPGITFSSIRPQRLQMILFDVLPMLLENSEVLLKNC